MKGNSTVGGRPRLLEVDEMPVIDGLVVPDEFYTVLGAPGRLAGMVRPSSRVRTSRPDTS